jgi:CRISPR-associated protein Cas1
MITLPDLNSHAPLVRVMAVHALAYCPRLICLEEVEEIRINLPFLQ